MEAESLLREGFALFNRFQSSMNAGGEAARGGVLAAFKPEFGVYAAKVEAFLDTQPPISFDLSGKLRSAAVLARDGEDQSTNHPSSYLNRVTVFMQSGRVNGEPGATGRPSPKTIFLLAVAVIVLFFMFGRRR